MWSDTEFLLYKKINKMLYWIARNNRSQYKSVFLAPITIIDDIFRLPIIFFTANNKIDPAKNVNIYDTKI